MSPGLKRARQPFFLRNVLTGVVLGAFTLGVWAYSIGAVKQDDFTDVDEEARALTRSGAFAVQSAAAEVEKKAVESTQAAAPGTAVTLVPVATGAAAIISAEIPNARVAVPPRGVLASLLHDRYPRLLDPNTKTFVWGAPSVDRMGRMGDLSLPRSK